MVLPVIQTQKICDGILQAAGVDGGNGGGEILLFSSFSFYGSARLLVPMKSANKTIQNVSRVL